MKSLSTPQLVALGLVSFAIVAGLLWKVPEWQVPAGVTVPIERAQLENEFRRTAAQITLGLGLLGTLFVGWRRVRATERTVEVAQEQQITERFTRAIDQLGNEASMAIRLGGIYALERIAKDSAKDHWQVMEVLTAYVRENARWEGAVDEHGVPVSEDSEEHHVTTDIQAILTVLGRRNSQFDPPEQHIDLSGTDLRGAELSEKNLSRFYLNNSNLQGAYLVMSSLAQSYLASANCQSLSFSFVDLQDSSLAQANLDGASFIHSNLLGTDLDEADIRGAILDQALNLTQRQIDYAITDENTLLPDHLKRPSPPSPAP